MKFTVLISSLLAAALLVVGCGDESKSSAQASAETQKVIKVGVCPGPYGDMVAKVIAPLVSKKGFEIEVITFSDYVQPNLAVDSGDIQANLFQHRAYFDNFIASQKINLKAVINVPTLGMGVFSQSIKSYDQLTPGSKVALPNDPVNLGRALELAQEAGLIELDSPSDDNKVSLANITSNPYGLEFVPMDAAQITRSLDSISLGFVPGNYAFAAKLDFATALSVENVKEPIKNVVAVKAEDQAYYDLFYSVIHSQQFKDAISADATYDQFTRPAWWDEVGKEANSQKAE